MLESKPKIACRWARVVMQKIFWSKVIGQGFTVSGQNTIGIYIIPFVLIKLTDVEQNAVNNNWLLKLQSDVNYKVGKNPTFT